MVQVLVPAMLAQVSVVPRTPWEMVLAGTPLTQGVFVILVVLSLVSWAVMVAKWREFARIRRSGDVFLREFEHAQSLDEAARAAARISPGPHTRVFQRALLFLQEARPAMAGPPDRAPRYSGSQEQSRRRVPDTQPT